MHITLFSILMAIGWSSLLIIAIHVFRKKFVLAKSFSITGLFLLDLFCMLRILFPFELPFTGILASRVIYTSFVHLLNYPIINQRRGPEVKEMLLVIWIISAGVLLFRLGLRYLLSKKRMESFPVETDPEAVALLDEIRRKNRKSIFVDIRKSTEVKVPLSFGLHKKYILLPDREYE